jgi:hypothetical protein
METKRQQHVMGTHTCRNSERALNMSRLVCMSGLPPVSLSSATNNHMLSHVSSWLLVVNLQREENIRDKMCGFPPLDS